jgi:hypothetical protein
MRRAYFEASIIVVDLKLPDVRVIWRHATKADARGLQGVLRVNADRDGEETALPCGVHRTRNSTDPVELGGAKKMNGVSVGKESGSARVR